MNYILLTVSMLSMVLKNCIFNTVGARSKNDSAYVFKFNAVMYILCAIIFFVLTLNTGISFFTALLGVLFSVFTVASNVYTVKALQNGPMHITVLITTSSMIIPTVFGMILSSEIPSIAKILSIAALIFFIYLSGQKDENGTANKKWILYCLITFVSSGIIGILQKIHQLSVYKDELFGFLCSAFACSFVLALLIIKGKKSEVKVEFTKKHYAVALVCGLCVFTMNLINLKLSGVIPSQIFFPLVNGGSIVITSLASVIIFKEKLTAKQIIGLLGGLISLGLICIL